MDREGDDGLHASDKGIVYEGRGDDCALAGVEARITEGAGIRAKDAELFHQSRRQRIDGDSSPDVGARESDHDAAPAQQENKSFVAEQARGLNAQSPSRREPRGEQA